VHVIPSCEIPSFCATDASSDRANARLEPHIGNAGESVPGILTREKSSDVAPTYPGFELGTYPNRIRRFFKETLRIARRIERGLLPSLKDVLMYCGFPTFGRNGF
jgi:hypothetical protein